MEQVTFLPCWLQGRVSNPCQGALQENVAKGKKWCCWLCWIYQLIIFEWKRWIIWAWNQISDLWILRWFPLRIYRYMSNQIFAELRWIMVQYVESDLDNFFNMQRPDCFVCVFPSWEHAPMGDFFRLISWGFSVCFASHSHLGSAVCYFMWIVFLFGCLATKVQILMMRLNVAYTKVPCRIRRK